MKDVVAKKSLGQNFLTDQNVLKKISDSIDVNPDDLIIEIGPGMGALSKYLVKKGCKVIAYEIDERMKNHLSMIDNLEVIYKDFLKSDFSEIKSVKYSNLYVIANIPYYITTPIIEHLLKNNMIPKEMVLLVQKEVAERFSSNVNSSDYGYFTVYLKHYFEVTKLFDVASSCFNPPPKVTSSVVKFVKKGEIVSLNENSFFKFVKQAFSQKRKVLKNNFKMYDWDIIKSVLEDNNLTLDVRAENVSYDVYVEMYRKLGLK